MVGDTVALDQAGDALASMKGHDAVAMSVITRMQEVGSHGTSVGMGPDNFPPGARRDVVPARCDELKIR